MVLIHMKEKTYEVSRKDSFRPLAGIMVLIEITKMKFRKTSWEPFPSPCGDYGSYQILNRAMTTNGNGFPSPCGDYGSYPLVEGQQNLDNFI